MNYPQIIVYEKDRRLATWLREAIGIAEMLRYDEHGLPASWLKEPPPMPQAREGWLLRECRQPAACLRLLRRGGPSIVVIELTKVPDAELGLLDQITWTCPDALSIVVGEEEHRLVAPLAWDLGATAVVLPPRVGERLQEISFGLMQSFTACGTVS